jgi:hypothetical protein
MYKDKLKKTTYMLSRENWIVAKNIYNLRKRKGCGLEDPFDGNVEVSEELGSIEKIAT